MKAELIIYRILSFLLLPVAALFGLNCLGGLLAAISNPTMLLVIFLLACMVIYIVASFLFLTKGIDKNSPRKPSLRDWIRINGGITFMISLIAATGLTGIKLDTPTLKSMMDQIEAQNHLQLGISLQQFQTIMQSFITFLFVLSIVLIAHIIMTFHMVKRFRYLFEPETMNNDGDGIL